ncbi:aldehyde ferredoxin oxidoreductase family protein [Desulfoluna spongiiphila]|uniref:Aldehyde:ferredoxin oxidoreductase n=1 Tax=Desulfoluna spongiiphila TaxID=419481 RepID=A0A1G5HJ12_9BACT|nr:aldehyde ferredoxin oxidoreductase C-terminal domain-containing protein [Desulfoluna spongiiphila]SCY63469.1 aldehyde:ferredoxin oxidoreductase [Desulfoluna spongiiphila]
MFGWCGTVLRVDLTHGTLEKKELDPGVAKAFLGGRGLNAKTLFDEVGPGVDPLGPENLLCFATGTLTATTMGLSSRLHVSTLSPYSGIMGDGNVGGSMANVMKRAGYDQIVVKGASEAPVYMLIEDEKVSLHDAGDLWGLDTWATTDMLVERHGKGVCVACIGQAGENLVRLASTMVDKYASASRGSGAVWGSKNLKAIVLRGTGRPELFDRAGFLALSKEDKRFMAEDRVQKEVASVYGSHYGITHWYPGYRNFEKELPPEEVPAQIRHDAWKEYEIDRVGCQSCHIKCKNIYKIPKGERKGEVGEGLEYEAVYCLGTNCGVEDPVAIMEMENLCDAYGVDVIAIGNTIALAKDLYNRGIIDDQVTCGLDLSWENAEDQVELVHKTVMREGFGNLIAEGMYSLAKIIGNGAMDYCYHTKGLGRGVYPAGLFTLAHAIATRGADHLRGRSWSCGENSDEDVLKDLMAKGIITDDPVHSMIHGERVTTLADTIGRCKGAVNTWTCALPLIWKGSLFDGLADMLTKATGIPYTGTMVEEVSDRIGAVERAFNARQGITINDDMLPQRPDFKQTPEGAKEREAHMALVRSWYEENGYAPETGLPTAETCRRLGIGDVADTLAGEGPYSTWDGPLLMDLDAYPKGGKRV